MRTNARLSLDPLERLSKENKYSQCPEVLNEMAKKGNYKEMCFPVIAINVFFVSENYACIFAYIWLPLLLSPPFSSAFRKAYLTVEIESQISTEITGTEAPFLVIPSVLCAKEAKKMILKVP